MRSPVPLLPGLTTSATPGRTVAALPYGRGLRGRGGRHHRSHPEARLFLQGHSRGPFGFRRGRKKHGYERAAHRAGPFDEDASAVCLALILAILAAPALHMNILGAILIVVVVFCLSVSSRITGEIGSSSIRFRHDRGDADDLPHLSHRTGLAVYYVTALSVGGIVCVKLQMQVRPRKI